MEWIRFIAAAICISGGVFVMISAAIGVYRFSECLTRMHAAASWTYYSRAYRTLWIFVYDG